ncbi:MAG: hypothetical protein QXN16_04145, partial [Candidatus Micrarchaeaceae archaeon]
ARTSTIFAGRYIRVITLSLLYTEIIIHRREKVNPCCRDLICIRKNRYLKIQHPKNNVGLRGIAKMNKSAGLLKISKSSD